MPEFWDANLDDGFLAYGGDVYDVTSGAHFYGPGMAYAKFAGRACTRGVALPSLDDDDIHDGAAGLDPRERLLLLDDIFGEINRAGQFCTMRQEARIIESARAGCRRPAAKHECQQRPPARHRK